MNILITGNMGYVGSELTKFLRKTHPNSKLIGYDIGYFKDNLTNKVIPEKYLDHQYLGDIRKFDENILTNIDSVIHLAAISNDPIGNKYEIVTKEVNYLASIKLAKAAYLKGIKTFIFASSCSVYGIGINENKTESCELNPLTAYAKSKIKTEFELKNIAAKNFIVTSLRFATACGKSSRLRLDLVLNDFVTSAFVNKKIEILSDGKPWRPIIDVEDMTRAITWAMNRQPADGGNYLAVNVGKNEHNFQIKDLAFEVNQIFPNIEVSLDTKNHSDNRSYKVDFGLLDSLAPNYTPQKSIEQSIEEIKNNLKLIKFNTKNFRESDFIRLKKLNKLRKQNRLNNNLEWID